MKQRLPFDLVIGFTLAAFGLFTAGYNFYSIFFLKSPLERTPVVLFNYLIIPVLGILLLSLCLFSLRQEYPFRKWSKGMQIFILLLMSGLSILEDYNSSFGIALFLMAAVLLYNYRMLNGRRIASLAVFIIIITLWGAQLAGKLYSSVLVVLFNLFFLFTVSMAYLDTLQRSVKRNETLRMLNQELKRELPDREKIKTGITAIRLNADEFAFTQAEIDIIKTMCDKGLTSNRDLADHLNKSESTVKTQLHSIYGKTGIHKRSSLIAFFKD